MQRPGTPNGQPDDAELLRQFQAVLAGMDPGDEQEILQQLLNAPAPSQRRERRADVVTYRVRVDLLETQPPLWRRLEITSDMFLDELHEVLQAAFGWTDSHLHRFTDGVEQFLCPFEMEEREVGTPEHEVRLDEVLVEPGDTLLYIYDFGDDWQHEVRLEAVLPRDEGAPRAVCTTGRRPGPPEDCGGVGGYELLVAGTDPAHPDHTAARAEFDRVYGLDVLDGGLAPTPFVIDEINVALAALPGPLPEPLASLVRAVLDPEEQARVRALVDAASIDQPTAIDAETAAWMVRPFTWLLDRVGEDGITLTGAGFLPPVHVEAAMTELGMADEWIGKHNREAQTIPVLELRETAQKMGLLRKNRGRLLVTATGHKLRTDPVALWRHIAARVPPKSSDPGEIQAGLTLLLAVAAGKTGDLDAIVAWTLHAIGWVCTDGEPIDSGLAGRIAQPTEAVLRRLGALTGEFYRGDVRPWPGGIEFAREALRTTA
ncbi:IS1096 element passenger TnpR family protein [Pseudonocardia zijingensis]|uniref:Plasmid pRiA4b Orf3-like domain-containing protein n=1 Tax=Pseudonocardia zijingensis TaxID=153376 RepID=A0ABP3ZTR2_9PSEU